MDISLGDNQTEVTVESGVRSFREGQAYEWIFSGTQYVLPHVPPLRVLESDKEQAGRLFPCPFLQSDQVSEGP